MPIQPLVIAGAGRNYTLPKPWDYSALEVAVQTEIEKDPLYDLLPSEGKEEVVVKNIGVIALCGIV